jgi:quinol monooxygenase YgiN
MRLPCRLFIIGLASAVIGTAGDARGQQETAAVYCVTYFEVTPSTITGAERLLRQLRAESRQAPRNLRFEVLQRRDRPNQFLIVEAWADSGAHDDNATSARVKHFRDALQPSLISGYDERVHTGLVAGPVSSGGATQGAIYAVTHVDFIPPKKDEGIAALRELSAASLHDSGNLRFEVLQQASRPNHLTLVEIWNDQAAFEKHEVAAHTVLFRQSALPLSGALFDQRLYRVLE